MAAESWFPPLRIRVPQAEPLARIFVKLMRQFVVHKFAQVFEPQRFEDLDRGSILRQHEGHDLRAVQLAEAVPQNRRGSFPRVPWIFSFASSGV